MLTKVQGRTALPVTLADAKSHLRVTHDDDDQLIRGYISAATDYCEDQIPGSRFIMPQTWDWKIHGFLHESFEIPRPPLQSLTSVKYYATNSSTGQTTVSSTGYILHTPTHLPGIIERHPNGAAWPAVANRADAVTFRFVAGYADPPDQFKQAVRLVVGAMYELRSDILVGTISGTIATGVKSLLGSIGYGDYS